MEIKEKAINRVREILKENNFKLMDDGTVMLGKDIDYTYALGREVGKILGLVWLFDLKPEEVKL